MYCIHCGAKVLDTAKFCHNCGQPMEGQHSADTIESTSPVKPIEPAKPPTEVTPLLSLDDMDAMRPIVDPNRSSSEVFVDQLNSLGTTKRTVPYEPVEINGKVYNLVQLAYSIDILKVDGMVTRSNSCDKLQKITGISNWKATGYVFDWEKHEELIKMVRQYQAMHLPSLFQAPLGAVPVPEPPKQEIHCPRCGGTHIEVEKQGFSATNAVAGAMVAGVAGLLTGFIGKNNRIGECLDCGFQWKLKK